MHLFVCFLKEVEMVDSVEKSESPSGKSRPLSLFQRLQGLKRELSSQQEEERVCGLKLKCLLDIVENWCFNITATAQCHIQSCDLNENVFCLVISLCRFIFAVFILYIWLNTFA